VTTSIGSTEAVRRRSSGKTSAALPTTPTLSASPAAFAATTRATAASRSVVYSSR
jgi:hypothetical protein